MFLVGPLTSTLDQRGTQGDLVVMISVARFMHNNKVFVAKGEANGS